MKLPSILNILKKIGKYFYKFRKKRVIFIETSGGNGVIKDLNNALENIIPDKNYIILPSKTADELKVTKKWL